MRIRIHVKNVYTMYKYIDINIIIWLFTTFDLHILSKMGFSNYQIPKLVEPPAWSIYISCIHLIGWTSIGKNSSDGGKTFPKLDIFSLIGWNFPCQRSNKRSYFFLIIHNKINQIQKKKHANFTLFQIADSLDIWLEVGSNVQPVVVPVIIFASPHFPMVVFPFSPWRHPRRNSS